ncbi:MAG TPA: hypothetical protein VMY37_09955 [Thermoguttaceae bacterium]|nr:hypothetical protein [Thermoguttaceae bacterium]
MDSTAYPATMQEANELFRQWPHLDAHQGKPVETIGRTLQRQLDHEPDPLPDRFIQRFAVSIVKNPEQYGRLFLHALESLKGGRHGG